MGLFSKPNLSGATRLAFEQEKERLKLKRIEAVKAANLDLTEGVGRARQANVLLGDQLDLEDLTEEERRQRATGRITPNTGLIL